MKRILLLVFCAVGINVFIYPQNIGTNTNYMDDNTNLLEITDSQVTQYITNWLSNPSGVDVDNVFIIDIASDDNGNIYFVGNFKDSLRYSDKQTSITGNNDIFFCKQNSETGEIIWLKKLKSENACTISNLIVNNDNIYLSGFFTDELKCERDIYQSDGQNCFVSLININGSIDWFKTITGVNKQSPLFVRGDSLGNIVIAGSYNNALKVDDIEFKGDYYSDIFMIYFDNKGEIYFQSVFKGKGNDVLHDLQINNNQLYLAINFEKDILIFDTLLISKGRSDALVMRMDNDSSFSFIKQIGSEYDDFICNICFDNDRNCFLTGSHSGEIFSDSYFNIESEGMLDAFLLKLNTNGYIIWADNFGTKGNDFVTSSVISENGDIYITGNFRGEIKKGDITINSNGFNDDIFLAKYTNNGILLKISPIGDSAIELSNGVEIDSRENIIVSGNYYQSHELLDHEIDSVTGNSFFVASLFDCSKNKSVKLPPDTSLCAESFTIIPDSGFINYSWNNSYNGFEYKADTTGYYYVIAKDSSGCISKDTIFVQLNIPVAVNLGNNIKVNKGEVIHLSPTHKYKEYFWSTKSTNNEISINTNNLLLNNFFVTLTATDSNNCLSSGKIQIEVLNDPTDNCFSFSIYPNPVKENLNYSLQNIDVTKEVSITIYESTGKTIYTSKFNLNQSSLISVIDVSDFKPGGYVVRIINGDNNFSTSLTVVQ